MAGRWPLVPIGEVAKVFDGPHATPKTIDAGPIFLGISALQNGRINLRETRHVTLEDFKTWTRRVKPQAGDIVFSYETRLGEAAMIPEDFECCLGRRMGLVRTDRTRLDPRFFLYTYLSPYFQDLIRSRTIHGATVDRIALKEFPSFQIPLPDIQVQRAIAHILGTLDDKIELNRKQNETLEAMARALFKAWFVDFEPVRAKMEGRWQRGQSLPGLPAHLYDLFPDRLVESELGEIPEGWRISTLGETCTYLNRGISPKYIDSGGVLVLNQKCIRDFSIDFSKARRHDATKRRIDGRTLEIGDVLVNSTGVGTLGRVAQVRRLSEAAIVDSHVTVVRPGPQIGSAYLGCFMQLKQSEIEGMGEGSTGQTELSRAKLGGVRILLPKIDVLDEFSKHACVFSDRIAENQKDSEDLAQLRDTLLPKLISGDLRIASAEALLKERGL